MSILKKISVLFVISFILMSIIGLWIDNINSKRIDDLIKDKYIKVANELFVNIDNPNQIHTIIHKYQLKKYEMESDETYHSLFMEKHTFGFISIKKESHENEFILHIQYLDEEVILITKDLENFNDRNILNILIFIDIVVLCLIFLYILKLLSPLKIITSKIKDFSDGNLNSRININSNDEIGVLSNSFNQMASRLESLIKSREELLRDIGHELRTPIAKGKFAIEKIDSSSQKELLKRIFLDLEVLTNELLELEKLNSTKLNFTTFSAETLILESLSKLYLEDESQIKIKIKENFTITADLHYLSIAIKNLIDNSLKYAIKFPIEITVNRNEIYISNYAPKLSKEINYYIKPFTQESFQRNGFGLGLSIVNKIIKKHNFNLSYMYKEGRVIFIINNLLK